MEIHTGKKCRICGEILRTNEENKKWKCQKHFDVKPKKNVRQGISHKAKKKMCISCKKRIWNRPKHARYCLTCIKEKYP